MSDSFQLSPSADDSTLLDRRRPGRTAVDEALVPLLRNPASDGVDLDGTGDELYGNPADRSAPDGNFGQGLSYGLLLSIPLWAAMAEAVHLALR